MPTARSFAPSLTQSPSQFLPVTSLLSSNPFQPSLIDSSEGVRGAKTLAKGLIRKKPTTPGVRHQVKVDRSHLWKGRPIKSLTTKLVRGSGRNNQGRITVRRRGGGHKKRYRLIDFSRSVVDVVGTVTRLEYDPNRSSWIALVVHQDGSMCYIIAPDGLEVGSRVQATREGEIDIRVGNALPLRKMPVGTMVHNIELLVSHHLLALSRSLSLSL